MAALKWLYTALLCSFMLVYHIEPAKFPDTCSGACVYNYYRHAQPSWQYSTFLPVLLISCVIVVEILVWLYHVRIKCSTATQKRRSADYML